MATTVGAILLGGAFLTLMFLRSGLLRRRFHLDTTVHGSAAHGRAITHSSILTPRREELAWPTFLEATMGRVPTDVLRLSSTRPILSNKREVKRSARLKNCSNAHTPSLGEGYQRATYW